MSIYIEVLKSKIHRLKVTNANLDYMGSITIDEDIMDKVGMIPNEKVQVLNLSNGERFETYTIRGERGSGIVELNGPAAHKGNVGDIVIVASYALIKEKKARDFKPKILIPEPGKYTIN